MQRIEGEGYTLYITEIAAGERGTRRGREKAAVDVLVREVFGPDASKANDALGAPHISIGGVAVDEPVSVSHSRRYALLAVGRVGELIGVDIEEWRTQLVRVVPRILSEAELARHDSSERSLLEAWTGKEAIYKAVRGVAGHEIDYGSELCLPSGNEKSACAHFHDGRRVELRLDYHEVGPDAVIAVAICRDDASHSR
ncbi:MAG: 4'-phosphopantetheinyl transferase superfamily protein [Muribaculaceae bacterium]|nr:4'-phosphopantetheinyl transferase superfamily protein [Muribaculaceae bacterium]